MEQDTKEVSVIDSGNVVFSKNMQVNRIAIIVKGTVKASNSYMEYVIPSGNVIGLVDANTNNYLFDYTAMEPCTVCYFSYNDFEDLCVIKEMVKDYVELCELSVEYQTKEIIHVYEALKEITYKIDQKVKTEYENYQNICKNYMIKPVYCEGIEKLAAVDEDEIGYEQIKYLKSLFCVKKDIHKSFFLSDEEIFHYHLNMQSSLLGEIDKESERYVEIFKKGFDYLYNTGLNNIFSMYSKLAIMVSSSKGDTKEIIEKMDETVELIKECKNVIEEDLGLEFNYDYSRIEDIYKAIHANDSVKNNEDVNQEILLNYSMDTVQSAMEEANDTLDKIIAYSEYDEKKGQLLKKYLTAYRSLKDKTSTEDDVRKLRNNITKQFYEIYELVFFKAEKQKNEERYIDAFLNFGLMDEKMLTQNDIVDLYHCIDNCKQFDNTNQRDKDVCIYTIRTWLRAIYNGERQPSKNEYDLDYVEYLRERKKREKFSNEYEIELLNDREGKVKFEIENMFRINNRLTNGQLSIFMPIIKHDDFMKNVNDMFASAKKIQNTMDSILEIDFSAFVREYLYENLDLKISKMSIYKEVKPDIILMPNVGCNGSMWQEISGKKRDSRGRFLIPAFAYDLQVIMIKLIGAFRWELCRTVQGTYWNDIREKSLTSEYCDYIQFYKKNKELSEVTKEKIKKQIVKCRNNTREFFVKDYAVWIQNESLGLARLNKVSRNILSTYCPFSKKYRLKVAEQPMFQEGVARFEREKIKKLKNLNNRYTAIRKENGVINDILEDNLKYLEEQ